MERDSNETQQQQPSMCRSGCGFYGNASTDGMCSKCYKDSIRRKQSSPTTPAVQCSTSTPSGPGSSSSDGNSSPKPEPTSDVTSPSCLTTASTVDVESTDRQPEAGPSSSQDTDSDSSTDSSKAKKKIDVGHAIRKLDSQVFHVAVVDYFVDCIGIQTNIVANLTTRQKEELKSLRTIL